MTTKETWAEVTERLEALALKLELHFKQAGADDGVRQAVGELREKLETAFTAAGNAVHDEAVRADAREVGQLLADAVSTTLARVGAEVRDTLERRS